MPPDVVGEETHDELETLEIELLLERPSTAVTASTSVSTHTRL